MTADRPALALDGLREKADKATPGPWVYDTYRLSFNDDSTRYDVGKLDSKSIADCEHETDADYIASLDPTTVLALLDAHDAAVREVEELRAVVARVRVHADSVCNVWPRGEMAARVAREFLLILGGDL